MLNRLLDAIVLTGCHRIPTEDGENLVWVQIFEPDKI